MIILIEIRVIIKDYPGCLTQFLPVFYNNNISMTRIESNLLNAKDGNQDCMFTISVKGNQNDSNIQSCLQELKNKKYSCQIVDQINEVPWYPQNFSDINKLGSVLLDVKDSVGNDSVQFQDKEYRKRRDYIADQSKGLKIEDEIPILEYLDSEKKTWTYIFDNLQPFIQNKFLKRYKTNFEKLQKKCGMSRDQIPQLRDVNRLLQQETGYTIKPTHGILSQREFLNAFAHKVFMCTQYMRHHDTPDYTPEPDICHEIIGHVPLFLDPEIAQLSHEIGLLSCGATDSQIEQMGALYWYTIEFGSVKEDGIIKPYGAGIAGSVGECKHYWSDKAKFAKLNPALHAKSDYSIQSVQQEFLYTESFDDTLQQFLTFGQQLSKPMRTYYDFNTKQVLTDRRIKAVETEQVGPLF